MIDSDLEEDFASILAKGIAEKIRVQIPEKRLRQAWEAGFQLAMDYSDNAVHFRGEQKEKQWKKYLDSIRHE